MDKAPALAQKLPILKRAHKVGVEPSSAGLIR